MRALKAFALWIGSMALVTVVFNYLTNWGTGIMFGYSVIYWIIYAFTYKPQNKFTSTKIELGNGTGFLIPAETKSPV